MGPPPAVALVRRAVRDALRSAAGAEVCDAGSRTSAEAAAPMVLVACSGGADSLALAAALAFEAPRAGLAAGLVTVDHGLQDGSARQAARVAQLGYDLGLDPVISIPVVVAAGDASSGGGGPEAAARSARYTALDACAASLGALVLLGHTLDDQAETVLLGLGRGSGPRSIAGMAPRRGCYLRPLLGLRRADTVGACVALGLSYWEDPQNLDPSFQRVRLRREVLPLLEDVLQGGVSSALARTAGLWRDDLDALDHWAEQAYAGSVTDGALVVDSVVALPRAVRSRVLRRWLVAAGAVGLSAERTGAVDALVVAWHGQGPVELPGGVRVHRRDGRIEVTTDV